MTLDQKTHSNLFKNFYKKERKYPKQSRRIFIDEKEIQSNILRMRIFFLTKFIHLINLLKCNPYRMYVLIKNDD